MTKQGKKIACFFYLFRTSGSVIVAENRRGSLIDRMDGRLHHLANTGYNSHDRDINITSCNGKNIIAADTYQAVSQLHDKSGRPQTDDIPGMSGALRNLIYMNPSYLQF